MNKKIISIIFLLILMVSITITYIYFNQKETGEKQESGSGSFVNDEDVANEIDKIFIDEDDEIEIGEIV
ncbi:MAG: hypothetical protein QHH15_04350 [Candidatus Thermoplasmatota archaeon]|jgi:regulatory protein YycI of two-component signal transduction system YycFG|nr:hypothetical protein [Candidatus Thermoplasmatota archaeon]